MAYEGNYVIELREDDAEYNLSVDTLFGRFRDPVLQSKSVSPTEQSQVVVPDSGYDGLSSVGVGAIPGNYIGSQVLRRTAADVQIDGPSVVVPAGVYSSETRKTVHIVDQAYPELTYNPATGSMMVVVNQEEGYVYAGTEQMDLDLPSVELATPTISRSNRVVTAQIVQPAGFTPGGTKTAQLVLTAQTIPEVSVSFNDTVGEFVAEANYPVGWNNAATTKSGGYLLSTQAGKTVTPTTSRQTAVAAKKYTTGVVYVAPIPSQYIVPSGTKSITGNGTYDVTQYASAEVNVDMSGYLLKSGGTMTGALTLDVMKGKSGINYGASLPSSGSSGQIFFLLQS